MLKHREPPAATLKVVAYAASTYMGLVGGFVTNVILARGLPTEERGLLAVALHFSYLLGALTAGGMERTLGSIGSEIQFRAGLSLGAKLSRQRAALAVAIACLSTPLWPGPYPAVATALLVAVLGAGFGAMICVRSAALGSGRTIRYGLTNSSLQVLTLALFFVGNAFFQFSWQHYLVCFAMTYGSSAAYVYLRPLDGTKPPPSLIRSSRSYAAGLLGSKLSIRADRLLIPAFASSAELGAYVIPAAFAEMMVVGISAISEGLIPRFAGVSQLAMQRASNVIVAALLTVAATVGLVTYGALQILVSPIFGAPYLPSVELSLALSCGAAALTVSQLAGNVLASMGASKIVGRNEIIGAVLALGCYLGLIPLWGALGAAIAATSAYSAIACMQVHAIYGSRQPASDRQAHSETHTRRLRRLW